MQRREKLAAQGKLAVRERIALLVDEGSWVEDGRLGQRLAEASAGGRRRDRPWAGRGSPRRGRRQRPGRQGRLLGRSHRREDGAGHRRSVARRAAGVLARRQCRRADHRPGRDVPRPSRRRADLPQPGGAVGQGAADLLPVRAERCRRRVHPELLRLRRHGRGQCVDVPGQPADGADGRGRGGDPGGDGRRPHALRGVRLRRCAGRGRRRRDRAGQDLLLVPADLLARAATGDRRRPTQSDLRRGSRAVAGVAAVRRARRDRRPGRRRHVLPGQGALGA